MYNRYGYSCTYIEVCNQKPTETNLEKHTVSWHVIFGWDI